MLLSLFPGPADARSPRSDPGSGPSPEPSSDSRSLAHLEAPSDRTRRSLAYCSATDRNVPVLVKLARKSSRRARPSYRDAERVVCLDYGVRCTGYLCPLFDVPTLGEDELEERPHRRPS